MPSYTARHKKSGDTLEMFCSIAEMEQWEKDNPEWEIQCGCPIIGYNVYSLKPTGHLKETIHEMKKKIPGNNLDKYPT